MPNIYDFNQVKLTLSCKQRVNAQYLFFPLVLGKTVIVFSEYRVL